MVSFFFCFQMVPGFFLPSPKLSCGCYLFLLFRARFISTSCSPGIMRQKDTAIFFPVRRRCRRGEAIHCLRNILSFQTTNSSFLLLFGDPRSSILCKSICSMRASIKTFRFISCFSLTDLDTRCIHSTTWLKSKTVHEISPVGNPPIVT